MDPHGDFQTPANLANAAIARLAAIAGAPRTVVEPTCGRGAFLAAVATRFPEAVAIGFDRDPDHLAAAAAAVPRARLHRADAFAVDWSAEAATWADPVWIVGNPPWVTAAALGRIDAAGPPRDRAGVVGHDARTGSSNFDLAEWIAIRLADALRGREAWIGLLCKTQTARRALPDLSPVGVWRIDARRAFGAAVDAGWLIARPGASGPCPVHDDLGADHPTAWWHATAAGVVGTPTADPPAAPGAEAPWRSGIKHDCAAVFELRHDGGAWRNGLGEVVDLEPERIAPWVKGGDLYRGTGPERALVLPVRHPSDEPAALAAEAPRTWAYLCRHADRLDARRSRIWRDGARFGLYGVGPYSFAPVKLAVSALHADLRFRVLRPRDGRPVLVDDTSYFLGFDTVGAAERAAAWLDRPETRAALASRTFADAKRKITRRALAAIGLPA